MKDCVFSLGFPYKNQKASLSVYLWHKNVHVWGEAKLFNSFYILYCCIYCRYCGNLMYVFVCAVGQKIMYLLTLLTTVLQVFLPFPVMSCMLMI